MTAQEATRDVTGKDEEQGELRQDQNTGPDTAERKKSFVRAVAGTVILAGFALGWFVNDFFYLIHVFAGLNLLQSSVTGFCPPEKIYERAFSG